MINNYSKNAKKLMQSIDMTNLPNHIAIIMDGNGRWAKKRLLPRTAGHKEGVERVKEIVETCGDIGIRHLTLYAFSTENWSRPKDEVDTLMKILVEFLNKELDTLHQNNVKINIFGDLEKLSPLPRKEVIKAIEKTKDNSKLLLNIALNYGGRDEIIKAIKSILEDSDKGIVNTNTFDEEVFKTYLYTKDQPDPDLLIRPSGELRISNFLLYQIAYTEFWFSNIYWPEFTSEHLFQAIIDYQKRTRRFGGI